MSKISSVDKLILHLEKFFSVRARSEKELRDYFRIKNYKLKRKNKEQISSSLVNSVIEKLKDTGMINDEKFAKAWIEARSKKYGLQKIKQELYHKGITKEIIEEIFSQYTANSQEVAQRFLEKKIERWKNLKPLEFRKKAYDFLLRRGFEYDLVKEIVEKEMKKR